MKARVKATGEIVEVIAVGDYINEFGQIIGEYKDANGILYTSYDLDFYIEEGITIPDYWTRLEHQYAGMAMNALISSDTMLEVLSRRDNGTMEEEVAREAFDYAHALVEKLNEKEERK